VKLGGETTSGVWLSERPSWTDWEQEKGTTVKQTSERTFSFAIGLFALVYNSIRSR
jgi:hypothetical protein